MSEMTLERLAEIEQAWAGYDSVYMELVGALRESWAEIERLRAAVIWMSGSADFGSEGQAAEYFRRDVRPLLNPLYFQTPWPVPDAGSSIETESEVKSTRA